MPAVTRVAVAGGVGLVAFVVFRAASFHHVDVHIGRRLFEIKLEWLLEIGGILLILTATYFQAAEPCSWS